MRPTGDPTFVYFIAPIGGGRIKIGSSICPRDRLQQLMVWSPVDLEILAMVAGNLYDEFKVQAVFIGDYYRNEWFHPSPALLATITEIATAGELPERLRGKQPSHVTLSDGEKDPKPRKKRSPESFERARQTVLARKAERVKLATAALQQAAE